MSKVIDNEISEIGLVPVVVIDDVADAVPAAEALDAGGVHVMEITLRTDAGISAIEAVAKGAPGVLVGAGTVMTLWKAQEAAAHGARFIVSPGFDRGIVSWCVKNHISVYPGCVTPTELMYAIDMGLDIVKFFPANTYGGVAAIKALSGPFPDIRFLPTGGVDLGNLNDYLIPQVHAVGGAWLCRRNDIREKRFDAITEACAKSVAIVQAAR